MSANNFFFVDMAALMDARPFDGMKAGKFTDMRGTRVEFKQDELADFLTNTLAAIDATRGESGELVGLPIDAKNHEHGDAAGWIVGAELAGDVIRLLPRWTELGLELVGKGKQRFFSPSVDLANKAIIGGSLTNWPATRSMGKNLLRPIELAEGEYTLDETESKVLGVLAGLFSKLFNSNQPAEEPEAEEPQPTQEQDMTAPVTPDIVELQKTAEFAALVDEKVNERIAELAKADARKRDTLDFSKRVTTGKVALAIPAEELSEILLSLPEESETKVREGLQKVLDAGIVNFSEQGSAGTQPVKKEIPAAIKPLVKNWLANGKSLESFFVVAEMGTADDFDTSEFISKG